MTAYPEAVTGHLRLLVGGTRFVVPVPLMLLPAPGGAELAIRISPEPEPVYLLEQPDGAECPVPWRECCAWRGSTRARDFFRQVEPDGALDDVAVRETRAFIGFVAYPSGWMATSCMADPYPDAPHYRLKHAANLLLGRPTLVDDGPRHGHVPR